MFQNITERIEEQEYNENKMNLILKELLTWKNLIISVITLLISTLSIKDDIMPFGLAIVAASLSMGMPVVGVFISALLRNLYRKWIKWIFKFYIDINNIFCFSISF